MQKKLTSAQSTQVDGSGNRKFKVTAIALAVIITLYLASLFLPLVSPFARYPLYLLKCGRRPIAASDFASGYTYTLPGDKNYDVGVFTNHYFCTEAEAHTAGFHKR